MRRAPFEQIPKGRKQPPVVWQGAMVQVPEKSSPTSNMLDVPTAEQQLVVRRNSAQKRRVINRLCDPGIVELFDSLKPTKGVPQLLEGEQAMARSSEAGPLVLQRWKNQRMQDVSLVKTQALQRGWRGLVNEQRREKHQGVQPHFDHRRKCMVQDDVG